MLEATYGVALCLNAALSGGSKEYKGSIGTVYMPYVAVSGECRDTRKNKLTHSPNKHHTLCVALRGGIIADSCRPPELVESSIPPIPAAPPTLLFPSNASFSPIPPTCAPQWQSDDELPASLLAQLLHALIPAAGG